MKGKRLAIGILVVLLCAMVPMAAMAAPAAKLVTYNVYLGTYGCSKGVWTRSPNPIGTLTIDTTTGAFSLTGKGLLPGKHLFGFTTRDHHMLYQMGGLGGCVGKPGYASANAKGELIAGTAGCWGKLSPQRISTINSALSAGGSVLIDARTVR